MNGEADNKKALPQRGSALIMSRPWSERVRVHPASPAAHHGPFHRSDRLTAAVLFCKEGLGFGWPGGDLLSRALGRSTISAEAFNGRVRDGIGFWAPRSSHRTGQTQAASPKRRQHPRAGGDPRPHRLTWSRRSDPRTWITRAIKPIERLVPVGSTRRRACTPGLSTWSSSTALWGVLVSREVSRLDAFSGYPVRT